MSLQVRLRHTLGERLLELPDRAADEPVVVGRSSAADIQVPSIAVSQRHCVLFVHEGGWAVQELPGTAGTFVNGAKLNGPTLLRVGDVVALGPESNAPAVDIDPIAATQGRIGQPAGSAGPVAAAAWQSALPADVAQPLYTAPPACPGPYEPPVDPSAYGDAAQPHPAHPGEEASTQTDGGDSIGWSAAEAGARRYYPRRSRRNSSSGLAFAVVLSLLIAGAAGFFLYQKRQQRTPLVQSSVSTTQRQTPATTRARLDDDISQAPPSIFEKMDPRRAGESAATRPAAQVVPRQPATANAVAPEMGSPGPGSPDGDAVAVPLDPSDPIAQDSTDVAAPPSPGPQADDPAWKQVQAARFSHDEARAILKFDDYARSHPDQFSPQLAEYTDKAMEKIWFERLDQLCRQRDELKGKIARTDRETAEETDDAYKKRVLIPLKEKYTVRLRYIEEELKNNMKYDSATPFNPLDDAQVEKLRRERDPAYYANWKNRVLSHIRRAQGELPWSRLAT